ncbi:asialoglycoprotein receptor 1-like [Anneissia japonica]|uniref:asialoglycoprotein receptor 1-like n=1 Tax=Anneissia japonica TaxID=1529436 RepID=UPI00142599C0|nr:asialoglycoprotein receptor 1-like [Anneissia japonica]
MMIKKGSIYLTLLILVCPSRQLQHGIAEVESIESKVRDRDTKIHSNLDYVDGLSATALASDFEENECSYTFKVSSMTRTGNTCNAPNDKHRSASRKKLRSVQRAYLNISTNVFRLEQKIQSIEERLEKQTEVIRKLQKYILTEANGVECDRTTGWIRYNNSCYWFSPRDYESSWKNANIICKSLEDGAVLGVLNDEQEASFVLAHADLVNRQSLWWLGCQKLGKVNKWTCVDGSPLRFIRWAANKPTNYYNDRCLQLGNLPQMAFTDTQCNQKWAFVCEKKIF